MVLTPPVYRLTRFFWSTRHIYTCLMRSFVRVKTSVRRSLFEASLVKVSTTIGSRGMSCFTSSFVTESIRFNKNVTS